MKVLIAGGTDFSDQDFMAYRLGSLHNVYNFSLILLGHPPGSRGTELLALSWAKENDMPYHCMRNEKKASRQAIYALNEKPEMVVFFPGKPSEYLKALFRLTRLREFPYVRYHYNSELASKNDTWRGVYVW